MKRIRFLFHKAQIDGKPLDTLIALWTWPLNIGTGPYSHAELQFIDRDKCFSSATRGNFTGVRLEDSAIVLKHPGHWNYIETLIGDDEEEKLWQAAQKILGAKYDYKGIFGFLTPWRFQDERKWYCSEAVAWICWYAGLLSEIYRVSPRRLSRIIAKHCEQELLPLKKH